MGVSLGNSSVSFSTFSKLVDWIVSDEASKVLWNKGYNPPDGDNYFDYTVDIYKIDDAKELMENIKHRGDVPEEIKLARDCFVMAIQEQIDEGYDTFEYVC